MAFYMVHEVPKIESFLREVAVLLKPRGKLLIVEPKFQVSQFSFEETIRVAQSVGLRQDQLAQGLLQQSSAFTAKFHLRLLNDAGSIP